VTRGRERLAAVRLRRSLIDARIADGHARLDRLWRLAAQLHPDKPLERGYARVERRQGGVIASAEAAKAAGAVTLHFADGAVPARVERAAATPYQKGDKPRPDQPSLL
ncbi:MAG: exodeoxyribonuclease large subunit, partial [Sphingomonas bacterium]